MAEKEEKIIHDITDRLSLVEKLLLNSKKSVDKLDKKMTTLDSYKFDAWLDKTDKLTAMVSDQAPKFKVVADIADRMKLMVGVKSELGKAEAQLKIALARIDALTRQVEQLQKDQMTTADLKALEKRLMEAVKKPK